MLDPPTAVQKYYSTRLHDTCPFAAAWQGFDSCSGVAFSVRIVTGKGTHSRDGVPVLLPAIRRYLIDQAYPFREGDGFISINFGK